MKQRGHVPHSNIHVSVSDLYIHTVGPPILLQQIGGPVVGIQKMLTDTYAEIGNVAAVSFLGIHKSDLVCSVINWPIGYMEHTLSDF